MVPAIQGRGEGSSAEGSSSGRATGPRGVVAVEVGGPTAQGLTQTSYVRLYRREADILQRLHTVWR